MVLWVVDGVALHIDSVTHIFTVTVRTVVVLGEPLALGIIRGLPLLILTRISQATVTTSADSYGSAKSGVEGSVDMSW